MLLSSAAESFRPVDHKFLPFLMREKQWRDFVIIDDGSAPSDDAPSRAVPIKTSRPISPKTSLKKYNYVVKFRL